MADRTLPVRPILTQELVRELLHYDPETGVFTWRVRTPAHFRDRRTCSAWNSRHAGSTAGWISTLRGRAMWSITIFSKSYAAHRLAAVYMTGRAPSCIDHANGDALDNRWVNLRAASVSQNGANSRLSKANALGVKGVCYDKKNRKYRATIRHNYRKIHLGRFRTAREAHAAYKQAAQQLFGEFANDGVSRHA